MSRTETRPNPHETAAGTVRSRRDSRSRHHPGARIGRLTGKTLRWRCRCDCGRIAVVSPNAQSCGCLQSERTSASARRHGHARGDNGGPTPLYRTWRSMRDRCENPRHKSYAEYGGRGIRVCERWLKFENFLADMGERPIGKTLDRIDNSRGYEPGNCRANRLLTHNGLTLCVTEWAERLNIPRGTIFGRLHRGWSVERTLSAPCQAEYRRPRRAG